MDSDFNAARCDTPVLPANAINITVDREAINGTYPPGARILLSCENGYADFGSYTYCQADGSWNRHYRCASNDIKSTSFHALRIGFDVVFFFSSNNYAW